LFISCNNQKPGAENPRKTGQQGEKPKFLVLPQRSSLKSKSGGFGGFAAVLVPQGFSVHTAQLKIASAQLSPVAPSCTVQSWTANPAGILSQISSLLCCA